MEAISPVPGRCDKAPPVGPTGIGPTEAAAGPPDQGPTGVESDTGPVIRVRLPVAALVVLAACGSDPDGGSTAAPTATPAPDSPNETTGSIERDDRPTPSSRGPGPAAGARVGGDGARPESPTSSAPTPSTDAADPGCRLVADLEDGDELRRWQIVNDGVMGGRSSAEATVDDSVLTLAGESVTDGGGFSSVRLALDEPLDGATRLLLRLRTDGRAYELTLADAAPGRDRRVSHQGSIPAIGGLGWEEVAVDLDDLDASVFGRPVEVDPFEPSAAVEVGVILADGRDGPFRLELDWIRACP